MKIFTTSLALLTMLLSTITFVSAQTQEESKSVLLQNEVAKPVLQDPTLPTLTTPRLSPPALTFPAPQTVLEPTLVTPTPLPSPAIAPASIAPAAVAPSSCCNTCGHSCTQRRRRCCPPPVPTEFCLTDPCGCTHEACIEVPACCCGEQPSIQWRKGVLGRQIATLCWACCDFEAKVIVTRKGKVRVRD